MAQTGIKETSLYAPVKQFLEGQGYVVKGEVGAVDVMACRGDEPPVLVELKTSFSLSLFHQAIERQAAALFGNAVVSNAAHPVARPRIVGGFADNGVAEERLMVEYYGETMPIESNDTAEGRQKNRRVEMTIEFE